MPNNSGAIKEIDYHRWRGKDEEYHAYYSDRRYAKDSIAKTPQAVVKIIGGRNGVAATRSTMEYIARIGKENETKNKKENENEAGNVNNTEYGNGSKEESERNSKYNKRGKETKESLSLETQDGELITGKEAIADLVNEWKGDFEKRKFIGQRLCHHAEHILLSADCEPNEMNYRKLQSAAREFLQREFNDKGYDYVFVVHRDTQHPHVHIVVKNRQRDMGLDKRRKLRFNKSDLLHLRRQFAFELERNGIEQIATRVVDDPKRCLEALNKRIEGVRNNMSWFQSRMKEPVWDRQSLNVDLRKYSANLQKEITRIREIAKDSKIPRSERIAIDKEFKELTKMISGLRDADRSKSVSQSVGLFMKRAEGIIEYGAKLRSLEPREPKDLAVEIMNIDPPNDKMIKRAEYLSRQRGFELQEKHLINRTALAEWINEASKLPVITMPSPNAVEYAKRLSKARGFELTSGDRFSADNLNRFIKAVSDLPLLPNETMIVKAREIERRSGFELRETDKLDRVVLSAWIKEAGKLPLPDHSHKQIGDRADDRVKELDHNQAREKIGIDRSRETAREKIDQAFIIQRDKRSEIYDLLQQPIDNQRAVNDKAVDSIDRALSLTGDRIDYIDNRIAEIIIRTAKSDELPRVERLREVKLIKRLVNKIESDIDKESYHKILKRDQLSQIREIRRDLSSIVKRKEPEKVTDEYGLDMRVKHLKAVEGEGVSQALTAREMIKEANAGIVTIERQIIEAERVIADVKTSGVNSKERKEHLKSLNTIRDRFLDGYAAHIKESAKLIDNAVIADRALRLDQRAKSGVSAALPPDQTQKSKGERDMLNKTIESYGYTLEKAGRFIASRFNMLDRFGVSQAIKAQEAKISRNFKVGEVGR